MPDNSLRILSIIPYKILPAKLGGEKGIAVFNEYLAQQAQLIGITTKNNDPKLAKGYTLLNILSNHRSRYINIFLFSKIKAIIKREKITHLITEHPYYAWLAWLLRRATGIKWVVHSHNIEFMRSKSIGRSWWRALKAYERWAYNSADKVFFISEDDLNFAVKQLHVDPRKSTSITYGIDVSALPSDVLEYKRTIRKKYGMGDDEKILLFNGALYHSTNYDALKVILDEINPHLLCKRDFRYKIIICGRGLPDFFNELKDYSQKNVIYAGFVDDISAYFKAADVFLNPILSGGGVKTKAIEAISLNCTVISTPLGALGIVKEVCGDKLQVINEGEWKQFAESTVKYCQLNVNTSQAFYNYYYWGNVIQKAVKAMQEPNA